MTLQVVLLLVVIAAALVLFSLERFPADVISLGALLVVILTGLLSAQQAFAGFGSDTVIMVFGLLALTAALVHAGVDQVAGRAILRLAGSRPLLVVLMVTAAAMSAIMSNTATTALFVPVVLDLACRKRTSASRLLMPLAFASILASSVTLMGSATNIVISGLMTSYYMAPLGLLTAFSILALLLTQPMSNQAAAVVVVPVALQPALQLRLNPRTFAAMIAVGASFSFVTPLEPSCLMVYGPGRYRFADFQGAIGTDGAHRCRGHRAGPTVLAAVKVKRYG